MIEISKYYDGFLPYEEKKRLPVPLFHNMFEEQYKSIDKALHWLGLKAYYPENPHDLVYTYKDRYSFWEAWELGKKISNLYILNIKKQKNKIDVQTKREINKEIVEKFKEEGGHYKKRVYEYFEWKAKEQKALKNEWKIADKSYVKIIHFLYLILSDIYLSRGEFVSRKYDDSVIPNGECWDSTDLLYYMYLNNIKFICDNVKDILQLHKNDKLIISLVYAMFQQLKYTYDIKKFKFQFNQTAAIVKDDISYEIAGRFPEDINFNQDKFSKDFKNCKTIDEQINLIYTQLGTKPLFRASMALGGSGSAICDTKEKLTEYLKNTFPTNT